MTDEELYEFARATLKSIELCMDQFFNAQLKAIKVHLKEELDARVEGYCSSTETSMAPSSPALPTSPKVESVCNTKQSEMPLDLVCSNISNRSDPGRSQSIPVRSTLMTACRALKAEKTIVASSDIVDPRSAAMNEARGTPTLRKMILAPMIDVSSDIVFVVRDSNQIWHGSGRVHRSEFPSKNVGLIRRLLEGRKVELAGVTEFDGDGRNGVIMDGRREAWSRRIAVTSRRSSDDSSLIWYLMSLL